MIPIPERELRASRINARDIARRRKTRRRRERLQVALWSAGIFAYIYLLLTIAFT